MKADFSKITTAVSTAAGKALKMKTSHKIAIGAVAAVTAAATAAAIVKTNQAKKQERSVKSLLIEDAARRLPVSAKKQISFEKAMEESEKPFELPNAVRKAIGLCELDELSDTFILEPKKKTSDTVIFYIHGSNFWSNPSRYHYAFMRKAVNTLGCTMIVPVYPKAPAHTAVEIQKVLVDRYLYLINDREIPSENIVFMGDAAGGGLALALLQKLRYLALPMPRQAFLISPWLDITLGNPQIAEIQPDDSLLNVEKLAFKGEKYAGDLELTHPAVSPIYGDLSGLPKLTVFAGTREIFCADVMRLKVIAEENGLDIDVNIYKNQMHFFLALPIPEADEAFAVIASEIYGVEPVEELPNEVEDEELLSDEAEDEVLEEPSEEQEGETEE